MGWATNNIGNSWAASTNTCILCLSYYNDTGTRKQINSITCNLATTADNDTIYTRIYSENLDGDTNGVIDHTFQSLFRGNGAATNAYLYTGTATKSNSGLYSFTKDKHIATTEVSGTVKVYEQGAGKSTGGWHNKVTSQVTFILSQSVIVEANSTVYFGVYPSVTVYSCKHYCITDTANKCNLTDKDNGAKGPLITSYKSGVSGTVSDFKCATPNVSLDKTVVKKGESVTVSVSGSTSGATHHYQWYDVKGTAYSGATSNTRVPVHGDYCAVYDTLSGYEASTTVYSSSITVVHKLNKPTGLKIEETSKKDNRFTFKENYKFSWAAVSDANANWLKHYKIQIWRDDTCVLETTTTNTYYSIDAAFLADNSYIRGSDLGFRVRAIGLGYKDVTNDGDWCDGLHKILVSPAIIRVKDGSWQEGTPWVKDASGTWHEATDVFVADSGWKPSV